MQDGRTVEQESAACTDAVEPRLPGHSKVDDDARTDPQGTGVISEVREHASAAATPAVGPVVKTPVGREGNRRGLLIAATVVAVLALAAGVSIMFLTSSSGSDDDLSYRNQLALVFGPVLGGNREVSRALSRLQGTKPISARAAVQRARQATTIATGAVGTLTVPAGSEQLARDSRQVLDREAAYLSAVGAVLSRPSSSTRSELQTLSSNLTSALSAAGPTVAGASQTVSGADRLAAWAPRAVRTLERAKAKAKADAKARAEKRRDPAGSPTPGTGAPVAAPATSGTSCGGGVYAGPNTTCAFAQNVRDAYYDAPGATASIRVFSPVTSITYTMSCAPSGSGVTCSGGNNASVTF